MGVLNELTILSPGTTLGEGLRFDEGVAMLPVEQYEQLLQAIGRIQRFATGDTNEATRLHCIAKECEALVSRQEKPAEPAR